MAKNISFDDYLAEQLKDPEFKAGFDAESAKLESAVALMSERERAGLTQRELAERADVQQSTIARILPIRRGNRFLLPINTIPCSASDTL